MTPLKTLTAVVFYFFFCTTPVLSQINGIGSELFSDPAPGFKPVKVEKFPSQFQYNELERKLDNITPKKAVESTDRSFEQLHAQIKDEGKDFEFTAKGPLVNHSKDELNEVFRAFGKQIAKNRDDIKEVKSNVNRMKEMLRGDVTIIQGFDRNMNRTVDNAVEEVRKTYDSELRTVKSEIAKLKRRNTRESSNSSRTVNNNVNMKPIPSPFTRSKPYYSPQQNQVRYSNGHPSQYRPQATATHNSYSTRRVYQSSPQVVRSYQSAPSVVTTQRYYVPRCTSGCVTYGH